MAVSNGTTHRNGPIATKSVERRVWINSDGEQILAFDNARWTYVGRWSEVASVQVRPLRPADAPETEQLARFAVELCFRDGSYNRVADSLSGEGEVTKIRDALADMFHQPEQPWSIPTNGQGLEDGLFIWPAVKQIVNLNNKSKTHLSERAWIKSSWRGGVSKQGLAWLEPVKAASGTLGLIYRIIYACDDDITKRKILWCHSFLPTVEHRAVRFSLCADLALMQRMELVATQHILWPPHYKPFTTLGYEAIAKGQTIMVHFRFGYKMPLTIASGETGKVVDFMRIVGDALTQNA